MRLKISWLIAAVVTFSLGVGIVSLVWFKQKNETKNGVIVQEKKPLTQSPKPQKRIEEAWNEMMAVDGCLVGT